MNTSNLSRFLCIPFFLFSGLHGFTQLQKKSISGRVEDADGNPVRDALISVNFNGYTLNATHSDPEGSYVLSFENYGNLDAVDLEVSAEAYVPDKRLNFDLPKPESRFDAVLKKSPTTSLTGIDAYSNATAAQPYAYAGSEQFISRTLSHTRYFRAGYFDPAIYFTKITQHTRVVDQNGYPVQGAAVKIKVPGAGPVWGVTDDGGNLTMHMQFEWGARQGNILIEAAGYKTRHLFIQLLDRHNDKTYQLRKK